MLNKQEVGRIPESFQYRHNVGQDHHDTFTPRTVLNVLNGDSRLYTAFNVTAVLFQDFSFITLEVK